MGANSGPHENTVLFSWIETLDHVSFGQKQHLTRGLSFANEWQNPGQLYKPATEMVQGFCKALKRGYHRTVSPRYYLSFLPRQDDDEEKKPRLVVQMDTEKPVSYMKPCLDHQFDQPLIVRDIHCPSFYV